MPFNQLIRLSLVILTSWLVILIARGGLRWLMAFFD